MARVPGSDAARRVVDDAIRSRVFPAAAVDVGSGAGSIWQEAFGTLAFETDAASDVARHPLRPRVADQTGRDGHPPHEVRRGRRARARRARRRVLPGLVGFRSGGCDRRGSAGARVGSARRGCSIARPTDGGNSNTTSARCRSSTSRARGRSTAISGSSCSVFSRRIEDDPPLASQFDAIAMAIASDVTFTLSNESRAGAAPTTALEKDVRRARQAGRRGAGQLRGRTGRCRRTLRALRDGSRRRRVRESRAEGGARRCGPALAVHAVVRPAICDPKRRARQFARARLGHHADDVVVRHADVAVGVRTRRLHRHVALDRSRPRPLLRAADEPRAWRWIAGADARRQTRLSRFR